MENKLIFMDVDGTLCNPSGIVPDSAKTAIKTARSNGHKIFLCTGRSKPEIIDEILEVGFDGVIGAGGGYIEIKNTVLEHKLMPEKDVRDIIDYFEKHTIGYYIESNSGLFGSANCLSSIISQISNGAIEGSVEYEQAIAEFDWFKKILDDNAGKAIDYSFVNKISFISNGHPYDAVASKFGDTFQMHRTTVAQFGPQSGEVSIKDVNKATAIATVLDELDIDIKHTLGYGDGNNDIDMFNAVAHGVAMENATPSLKALSHEITPTADDHGIALSFKKNGFI